MSTINLNLITTAFPTDDNKTVEQWILELAGASNSNMTKIDDYAGETDGVIDEIKGAGWTSQTIKGNADAITALNGRVTYTVSTAGTNALTATISQITTPLANSIIKVIPTANNTGAMTFNVNGEGALPVTKVRTVSGSLVYTPMDANDFRTGSQVLLTKSSDGVRWISLTHGEIFARNIYYDNGNGTYTTAQAKFDEKVNKAGDTMTGALKFDLSSIKNYKSLHAFYNSGDVTGTFKLTLPVGWSGTSMILKLAGYNYDLDGDSWDLFIAGTNVDLGGGSGLWTRLTAKVNGNCPFNKVRFGYEGGKCVILLGTTSTVWNRPNITLYEFMAGTNNVNSFSTGWTSSVVSSESGITDIVEQTLVGTTPTETVITTGFASGWSGSIVIRKNQENLKTLVIDLTKTTDIAPNDLPYTLGVDYRPFNAIQTSVFGQSASALVVNSQIYMVVDTNGGIYLYDVGGVTANVRRLRITVSYY